MELRIYRKKVVNIKARFFVRLPIGSLTAVFDRKRSANSSARSADSEKTWRRHPPRTEIATS